MPASAKKQVTDALLAKLAAISLDYHSPAKVAKVTRAFRSVPNIEHTPIIVVWPPKQTKKIAGTGAVRIKQITAIYPIEGYDQVEDNARGTKEEKLDRFQQLVEAALESDLGLGGRVQSIEVVGDEELFDIRETVSGFQLMVQVTYRHRYADPNTLA